MLDILLTPATACISEGVAGVGDAGGAAPAGAAGGAEDVVVKAVVGLEAKRGK